jgi:hypothetical protein
MLGVCLGGLLFLYMLLLPNKVPQPRQQRFIQRQLSMVTSEEGEVYKSLVLSRMNADERERFEAEHTTGRHAPNQEK